MDGILFGLLGAGAVALLGVTAMTLLVIDVADRARRLSRSNRFDDMSESMLYRVYREGSLLAMAAAIVGLAGVALGYAGLDTLQFYRTESYPVAVEACAVWVLILAAGFMGLLAWRRAALRLVVRAEAAKRCRRVLTEPIGLVIERPVGVLSARQSAGG